MTFDHQKNGYGSGFGFVAGYGPSRIWPMENHLFFRLFWGSHNFALEFNPTMKELDRVHRINVKAVEGLTRKL